MPVDPSAMTLKAPKAGPHTPGLHAPPANTEAPVRCFQYGQLDHVAKGCVNHAILMGQFQIATQADSSFQFPQGLSSADGQDELCTEEN